MIHKKLLSLLVLLLTAASGAWATVYNSGNVDSEALKVGDVIYDAVINHAFKLAANRYKYLDAVQNANSNDFTNIVVGSTGTIMYDYKPVTADGQDGNAWVVVEKMSVSPSSGEAQVLLGGVIYKSDSVYVTTDAVKEDTTFTKADFLMPAYDAIVDYELVRDMAYKVTAKMDDRIRIKKDGNGFVFADVEKRNPVVVDSIDALNPDTLVYGDKKDYDSLQIQQKVDGLWVPIEMSYKSNDWLVVDTFRYVVRGCENYDGIAFSNEFVFYDGYPVKIPAKEFVTYYMDEALGLLDNDYIAGAALYTITEVNGTTATATQLEITYPELPLTQIAPANTPLLIYNSSDDTLEIKLIPTTTSATVSHYSKFTGVLEPTTLYGDYGFYAFNGKQFVYVRRDMTLPANKCCLKIENNSGGLVSGARAINIVFEEATGIRSIDNSQLTIDNDGWYDLNGRKLNKQPNRKGVYIKNGKKVIIK